MKAHKTPQEKQALKPMNLFESLTEEVIFSILDCLSDDPQAKKSFSLVCKSFHAIEARHRKRLKLFASDFISRALQRYPFVEQLDLTHCPRVEDTVLEDVSCAYSSTLRSIDLSRSRFFTQVGLSCLTIKCSALVELDLSNAVDLTDSGAAAIAEAKNLEKLWLARCKMISDIGIGCIAVGCKKLMLICLKGCLRVTDLGVGLIALKCKEIRSLDLSHLQITEECLSPILHLQHLKELILVGCPGIDDVGLTSLKRGCKSLELLNLSYCPNVTHAGLSSLTYGAESLRELSLAYSSVVTNDLAKCLYRLTDLQSVKLDGCQFSSSPMKAIADSCASLKELSLCRCPRVTDEGLSYCVQKLSQLRKLDITCCRKITYAAIDSITTSCPFLTSLRMESCSMIQKEAILLIGQRLKSLEELDITENEVDDEGLLSISMCDKLESLKMGVCLDITDYGLLYVGKSCKMLKELDLYRCMEITDAGIAAIANGCPALEMINMAYCDKVTDASLVSLSNCLQLKVLEIRGCSGVSSAGLSAVAAGCKQLTILDIKKCHNIDDTGMLHLSQRCQYLKQINLSYCSVTDVGLLALVSIPCLQNMTILHVTGLTPNGLIAALLASRALTKVKLHMSFKSLIPQAIFKLMEARGCVFHWRNKAFQAVTDPKGWQLHLGRLDPESL